MGEGRKGFLLGVAAYGIWGLFPLYWPLLEPAGAVELLSHRVAWSSVTMVALVLLLRRRRTLVALLGDSRRLLVLAGAAVMISVNWGVYIWAVNNENVVEASLGYFINPLVTVLAGVLILRERLRRMQWVAVGIAALAVLTLTADHGRPPWVALTLAFSFASYGLLKKYADVGAVESLTVETLMVAPVAVGYLFWLGSIGGAQATTGEPWRWLLLASSGIVTALPLICFGGAATRISLTTLGLLQYLTPTLQFLLGVLVYDEPMATGRWVGFAVIWLALTIFTADSFRQRQLTRLRVEASAV
jgi:chloramphenicol-sensitive protein RarD